ncbi:MAG: response regulator [Candidatus Acidiferrales bacterium]
MTLRGPIRIIVADDHSIVREGLTAIINRESDMKVIAEACDWLEAVKLVLNQRPDVAVIDLHMPGLDGAKGILAVRERYPAAKIIVFSAFDTEEEVYEVLQAGASGYVLKGESGREDLLRSIRAVSEGEVWIHPSAAARLAERMRMPSLTVREKDILKLVAAGKSNKEIGSSLDVTEGTVKVHMNHIFTKLGTEGRVAAVRAAIQRGIVRLTGPGPLGAGNSKGKSERANA